MWQGGSVVKSLVHPHYSLAVAVAMDSASGVSPALLLYYQGQIIWCSRLNG